jgi:hypothetical protein
MIVYYTSPAVKGLKILFLASPYTEKPDSFFRIGFFVWEFSIIIAV